MYIEYISKKSKKLLVVWILFFILLDIIQIYFADELKFVSLQSILAYPVFIIIGLYGIIYILRDIKDRNIDATSLLFIVSILSGTLYSLDGGSDIQKLVPLIFHGTLRNYFGIIFWPSFTVLIILLILKEIRKFGITRMTDFFPKKEKLIKYMIFMFLIVFVSVAIIMHILNTETKQTETQIEFKLPENSYPIQNPEIGANAVISFTGDGGLLIHDHSSDPQQDALGIPTQGNIGKFVDYVLIGGLTNENLEQAYIEILYTDELLNAHGITDPSLLRMYFWDETSKQWVKCGETSVNTDWKMIWATVYRFPMLLPLDMKEKYGCDGDCYFATFAALAIEEMPNEVTVDNPPVLFFTPDPQVGDQTDGSDAIYIEIYQDSGMQNKFLEAKWEGIDIGGNWITKVGGEWVFIPENKFPEGYYYYRIREKVNGELREWTHLVEFRIMSTQYAI